jgi:hypothetical protein
MPYSQGSEMYPTSHTTPGGVVTRIYFSDSDAKRHGESGGGYIEFDDLGTYITHDATFRIEEDSSIVEEARSVWF